MAERIARSIVLCGGPADGVSITVTWGQSLLLEDPNDSERVARYRPSRKQGFYTFRGYDRVVARLPSPPDSENPEPGKGEQ